MRALIQLLAVALLAAALAPAPVAAWEGAANRLVTAKAIETLPYPLRGYFEAHSAAVAQLASDPAIWPPAETPRPENTFIQLDRYGAYPFGALPREHSAAVQKFGRRKVDANGKLPWQVSVYYAKLEEAFRAGRWEDARRYAGILARYVAAAHDPFNTTMNATGELSHQPGVNGRFGGSLVERFQMFFLIHPSGAYKIDDPTAQAFGIVLEAHTWVDNILFADAQARAGRRDYNDEYFDAFYDAVGALLIRQLTNASQSVGAYWFTAWQNAGRPAPPAR